MEVLNSRVSIISDLTMHINCQIGLILITMQFITISDTLKQQHFKMMDRFVV